MKNLNFRELKDRIRLGAATALIPVANATHLGGISEHDIPTKIDSATAVYTLIAGIATFLFNIFLGLAVIFIIVAALFYLTAAGNQTQLDRAKNVLIYSIVAIVIALIAGGVTSFINTITGAGLK